MEIKAKQIGGSIGIIIPKEIVRREKIKVNDVLKVRVAKTGNLAFLWGKGNDVKKPTSQIMREIDEGELHD